MRVRTIGTDDGIVGSIDMVFADEAFISIVVATITDPTYSFFLLVVFKLLHPPVPCAKRHGRNIDRVDDVPGN